MNLNFSKIKIPKINFRGILSLNPRAVWNGFLWSLIVLAICVIIFDAWVFWHFSRETKIDGEIRILRTKSLEKSIMRVNSKKSLLEEYKKGISIEDPS